MKSIFPFSFVLILLAGCTKADKKFFCSKDSNHLRKRFHIPMIEENMIPDENPSVSDCRYETRLKFPVDSIPLHAWKTVDVGRSILTFESDAFRKKIDDTLFYQLNVHSKFMKDSSIEISGLVFYVLENESKSISLDFNNKYRELDRTGVDSVKKNWNLIY